MGEKNIFSSSYDVKNRVLSGKIEKNIIEKDDSKEIYSLIEVSVKGQPDYNDYILDAGDVTSITIDSFGYLMKALGIVKRTSGYMVLVMKEELLQQFMLTNPEMFDFYAVFFNKEDALKYILSKR